MSSFLTTIGLAVAAIVVMSAWAFRSSNAPLWAKIVLCAAPIAISFCVPYALKQTAGYPVAVTFDKLPTCFDLVSYTAGNKDKKVDVWIIESWGPRAYELPIEDRIVSGIKIFIKDGQPGSALHLCKDADGDSKPTDPRYANNGVFMSGKGGLHMDETKNLPLKSGH